MTPYPIPHPPFTLLISLYTTTALLNMTSARMSDAEMAKISAVSYNNLDRADNQAAAVKQYGIDPRMGE